MPTLMNKPITALLCLLCAGAHAGASLPAFVPLPDSIVAGKGRFRLTANTAIIAPAGLANEADFLAKRLRAGTGMPVLTLAQDAPVENTRATAPGKLVRTGSGTPSINPITLAIDRSLAAEGYALEIAPAGVTIRGGSPAGVFYGAQTFMQTLPAAVHGGEPDPKADWSAPALSIRDQPTMAWRGVMLDSARHFQPKAFILKFLDAMAAQKLNRFHWHLTDNEAWRLEIKRYPKLTRVTQDAPAYYPEEIPTNPTLRPTYRYGRLHGGGFYSQADVREIVAHATARHIVIVPEIEIPGHADAALTAYPEFSVTRKTPVVRSNHSPELFGVHPEAISFLKHVLDETTDLFPGPWIHLGGDESFRNPDNAWRNDAGVQDTIDALGLRKADPANLNASEEALHAWLMNTLSEHLAKRGRRAIGWEEIMHGDNLARLSPKPVVLSWLVRENAVKSANSGYDVIQADGFTLYLDSRQSADPAEPGTLYDGPFTAQSIHRLNLSPAGIAPENRSRILGAQASLWTELMPRTDDIEYQAFPRLCALAELTWTAPDRRRDTFDFIRRLAGHGERLTALGLNHRRVEPVSPAIWTPDVIAKRMPLEFPLPSGVARSVSNGAPLTVTFRHRFGANGLAIAGVELLSAGKVVAADRHPGFAGGVPRDETYTLTAPKGAGADTLVLHITAWGEGGDDSAGEIVMDAGR